jgi:hypothetical protein
MRGRRSPLITVGSLTIEGNLNLPAGARAVVLFSHGSGSSRYSSRNRHVARVLNEATLATLLIDLLSAEEEEIERYTAHLRFDIGLLAERLVHATDWLAQEPDTKHLRIGYFGRVRAPPRPWWRRPRVGGGSARSYRVADALTWPARHWSASMHPRCSSSAGTTSRSSSSIGQPSRNYAAKDNS